MVLAVLFPGSIHFYPIWKGTVSDAISVPFTTVEDALHTEIIHPKRLIPGRPYRLRIETSNAQPFTSPQKFELQLWEDDPHIFLEDINTSPVVIAHVFPPGDVVTLTDILHFSMENIDRPYDSAIFNVRLASIDGTFTTAIDIPIDFYSVPISALIALAIPVLVFLVKALFRM